MFRSVFINSKLNASYMHNSSGHFVQFSIINNGYPVIRPQCFSQAKIPASYSVIQSFLTIYVLPYFPVVFISSSVATFRVRILSLYPIPIDLYRSKHGISTPCHFPHSAVVQSDLSVLYLFQSASPIAPRFC